ncbi:DNA polymerase III subunit delta [Neobacillus notoginsengisoli]|uniref:DNA polymerase III subunit delta n=1 Tax=Neobacillus notoginsengisoli TaxID=1578198 RepID=A0A417YUS7_9BACI|nr:DNA polymerase III subunit delta [Neobacillus notoginsengisoli]RHW40988.1 DNA polymerase III subunit delta [Neobacillus notoginsengisoli]
MAIELWKQIKNKQFSPVYLLYGTESFLMKETGQLLLENVLGDERDFNFSTYDLEETPIEAALEDAETFPFMGDNKVIFIRNPFFLTSEKQKDKVIHNLSRLETYLNKPAPYSIVVFFAPYEKLDERKKITKELKRRANVAEMKKLSESDLKSWVDGRARKRGIELDRGAVETVIALAGTNLFMLSNELDKLALYAGEGGRVDAQTAELLIPKSLEQNIFSLTDKVVQKKPAEALRIYYDLLKQNEEPIKILALLAGQFRLIYQIKELSRKGYGQQQIAAIIKAHPYRVKMAAGLASKFSDGELASLIGQIAEADYQMKTGGADKSLLVEMFLMKLGKTS